MCRLISATRRMRNSEVETSRKSKGFPPRNFQGLEVEMISKSWRWKWRCRYVGISRWEKVRRLIRRSRISRVVEQSGTATRREQEGI